VVGGRVDLGWGDGDGEGGREKCVHLGGLRYGFSDDSFEDVGTAGGM
jgi:hypothetical protein